MTSMTLLGALKDIRKLLTPPTAWIKDTLAVEKHANGTLLPVSYDAPEACAFCLYGATKRIIPLEAKHGLGWLRNSVYDKILNAIEPNAERIYTLPSWNDAKERTHAEVLALLDKAIATEVSQHPESV